MPLNCRMTLPKTVSVLAQAVPVAGEYDVVVCGGGPAGIGAAVAAGRSGARTLLIERLSHVGGMTTGALVMTWCDSQGGPVFDEFIERLEKLGAAERFFNPKSHLYKPGRVRCHDQTEKAVALRMIREAGAEVLFCTMAESAWVDEGAVHGVFVVNKGGRSLIKARVVIDATADGDISASAGAEFLKGDPDDGRLQNVTFTFIVDGVDEPKYEREKPSGEEIIAMVKAARAEGRLHPPNGVFIPPEDSFPFSRDGKKPALRGWEIEGVDPTDSAALSAALAESQLALLEVVEFCRASLPGFEECRIARFPDLLGTRESRRIIGQYVLTGEDVLAGRKFDDGIAQACFYMDLHDSPPGTTILDHTLEFKKANRPPEGDWYEIPYRCLVPKEVKGLLIAGRCISSDRDANGSLRIMPTCMFTGQAAGTAAGMAVAKGVLPHRLDGRRVREKVIGD